MTVTRGARPVALAPAGLVLAGCTGGPAGPEADGDVAELRMQGAPLPSPPGPGDRLQWETPALAADPAAVRDGFTATYGLSFSQESAGVYPGTRWFASTGSAVEPSDVTRDASVLVDRDGRLRAVTCLVAGPLSPEDGMLERCAELAELPAEARRWVAVESRQLAGQLRTSQRPAGAALVSVTTAGGWDRRTQSVQVTGREP